MKECWVCGRTEESLGTGGIKKAVVEYAGKKIEVDLCSICFTLLKGEIQD